MNYRKIILTILKMFSVGALIGILLALFFGWGHKFSLRQLFIDNILPSVILTIVFWSGNKLFIHYLIKKYSWTKQTKKIAFLHLIVAFSFSTLVIFLFYVYYWFIEMHKHSFSGFYYYFKTGFYLCMSINVISSLIIYCYHFLKSWKKSVLNEERLKRESLALQYESLKNQVNPHFLFNSLNVLTSLIEKDPQASIKYVKQLSDVFRYVLDQNARELVYIETELKFINSYSFLQQIRFGSNFRIKTTVKEKDFLIVPLALQILIENAVKHNEISTENPLTITIYDDDQYLYVSNNKQLRSNLPDSNQIGLKTLDFQYEFLSGNKMEILNDDSQFVVKLPKIKR